MQCPSKPLLLLGHKLLAPYKVAHVNVTHPVFPSLDILCCLIFVTLCHTYSTNQYFILSLKLTSPLPQLPPLPIRPGESCVSWRRRRGINTPCRSFGPAGKAPRYFGSLSTVTCRDLPPSSKHPYCTIPSPTKTNPNNIPIIMHKQFYHTPSHTHFGCRSGRKSLLVLLRLIFTAQYNRIF